MCREVDWRPGTRADDAGRPTGRFGGAGRDGSGAGPRRGRPTASPCCRGCCWAWAPSPTSSRARPPTPGSAASVCSPSTPSTSHVVFRAFDKEAREARSTRWRWSRWPWSPSGSAIGVRRQLAAVLPAARAGLGRSCGGRWPRRWSARRCLAGRGASPAVRDGWGAVNVAYGTFISAMVTAAILALSETVTELRATRQELARTRRREGAAAVLPRSARPARPHAVGDRGQVGGRAPAGPARHGRGARPGRRHRVGRPPGAHRDPRGGHRLPRGQPRHRTGPGRARR